MISSPLLSFNRSLAKGGLFDVECRDSKTGDGAFLTVAHANGKSLNDLPKTFFTDALFSSTGRFSFYGQPTDVKVKKDSGKEGSYRYLEIVFSNLSQSTNAEIPRTSLVGKSLLFSLTEHVYFLYHHTNYNTYLTYVSF